MGLLSPIRILYIEDDQGLARLFQRRLERAGFEVEIASDGAEGLDKCSAGSYDIIFVDQQMPRFTGIEVLRALADRDHSGALVMVTGCGNEKVAVEAMKLGATDYLIKDPGGEFLELIPSVIDHALQKRRLQEAKERAEAETRLAREQWERTFDSVPDLIMILDKGFRIVRVNKSLAARVGVAPSALEGRTCYETVHGTDRPLNGCPHELAIRERKEQALEVVENNLGGEFAVTCTPLFDRDGEVVGAVHVARDITDRKRAQEAMVHKERLKAVGELATGVAHNFNNMLQIITGAVFLARRELDSKDRTEMARQLDTIHECVQFGSETVKRLQRFAGLRADSASQGGAVFDVADTVRQAVDMSRVWWHTIPERDGIAINVTTGLEKGCWFEGQENEIFEVVLNLLKNAVEALPHGGEIKVGTAIDKDESLIQITDNGVGITRKDLHKIFDPFFTTKGFQRTGMGLASAFGIVQRAGGKILVESDEEKGTSFSVRLPLAKKEIPEPVQPTPALPGKYCILLIDDLLLVVTAMKRALSQHGFEVLTARSGQEGLEVFKGRKVDMVLCDLGMPHMNGWEVGKQIRTICETEARSKPPFILVTGWGGQLAETEKIADSGVDRIMEKPVGVPQLVAMINEFRAMAD